MGIVKRQREKSCNLIALRASQPRVITFPRGRDSLPPHQTDGVLFRAVTPVPHRTLMSVAEPIF